MSDTFLGSPSSVSRKTYMNMGNELIILLIFVKKCVANFAEHQQSSKKGTLSE